MSGEQLNVLKVPMLLQPLLALARFQCIAVGPSYRPPHEPLDPIRAQWSTRQSAQTWRARSREGRAV